MKTRPILTIDHDNDLQNKPLLLCVNQVPTIQWSVTFTREHLTAQNLVDLIYGEAAQTIHWYLFNPGQPGGIGFEKRKGENEWLWLDGGEVEEPATVSDIISALSNCDYFRIL